MGKTNRLQLRVFAIIAALLWGFTAHAELIGQATNPGGGFIGHVGGPGSSYGISVSSRSECCLFSFFVAPGSYTIFDGGGTFFGFGEAFMDENGIHHQCQGVSDRDDCQVGIGVNYMLTLPDYGSSPPDVIALTVPLTFDDFVSYNPRFCLDDPPPPSCEDYGPFSFSGGGSGVATVTLMYTGAAYRFESAVYTFGSVPEPATMTLAGLGLLAVILLRCRAQRFCPDCRRR